MQENAQPKKAANSLWRGATIADHRVAKETFVERFGEQLPKWLYENQFIGDSLARGSPGVSMIDRDRTFHRLIGATDRDCPRRALP